MRARAPSATAAALAAAVYMSAPAVAGTTTTMQGGVEVIVTTSDAPVAASARASGTRRAARAYAPAFSENRGDAIVRTAMSYLGTPYVFGGATPSGFDCSGFVQYVFAQNGIRVPRTADVQFEAGRRIPSTDPQPGDLVFFQTYDYGASHVGIYLGEGRFVNAIGHDVHIASFDSPYFRGRYLGARSFLPD